MPSIRVPNSSTFTSACWSAWAAGDDDGWPWVATASGPSDWRSTRYSAGRSDCGRAYSASLCGNWATTSWCDGSSAAGPATVAAIADGEIARGPAAAGGQSGNRLLGQWRLDRPRRQFRRLPPRANGLRFRIARPCSGNRFRGTLRCGQHLTFDGQHQGMMRRSGRRRQLLGIVRGNRRQAVQRRHNGRRRLRQQGQPHDVRGSPGHDRLGRLLRRTDRSRRIGNPQRQRPTGLQLRTWQEIVCRLPGRGRLGPLGLASRRFGSRRLGQLLDELFGNELHIAAKLRIGRQRADRILRRSLDGVGQPIHQPILLLGRTAGLFPQRPDAVPGLLPIDHVARSLVECFVDVRTVLPHEAGDGRLLALIQLPQQADQLVPGDGLLAQDLRHPGLLALGILGLQREKNGPTVALLDQPQPDALMFQRQLGNALQGCLGPRSGILFLGRGGHQEASRQQQTQRRRHNRYTREVRQAGARRTPRKG